MATSGWLDPAVPQPFWARSWLEIIPLKSN
jgi:hypothetical protein